MQSIQQPTILIVDDVPRNIQVVASILQPEGYKIKFAKNAETALASLEKDSIDLILLDIMMPEVNGFELCSMIKNIPKISGIPVIFLTARSEPESISRGFEVGGVDYVIKPFNSLELLARVRTHINLKRIENELRMVNAIKAKFFAIIAHDLKNPFSSLISLSELMLNHYKKYSPEKIEEFIQMLYKSSKRLYALLENLLDWSKSQTGGFVVQSENHSLKKLTIETIDIINISAKQKNIIIDNQISEDINVLVDKNCIKTVIRNLLSNAVKYSNEGDIVYIRSTLQEDFVQVDVVDMGVGVLEENLSKLFLVSSNIESTIGTKDETGTGLGLIVCKEFIDMHGGQIFVKGNTPKGSIFSFTIPLKD